jgi:hypothetical protein
MHITTSLFFFLSVAAVALFSFVAVAAWSDARRLEREAYYKSETLKKIADSPGDGGKTALELMREEERIKRSRILEGQKLGGLVMVGVGVGILIFLKALVPEAPVYLAGLIPLLIGVALLVYAYAMAPKE